MAMSDERKPQHFKKKEDKSSIKFRRTSTLISVVALIASMSLVVTSCSSSKDSSSSEIVETYATKVQTTITTTEAPEPVLTLLPGIQERLDKNKDSAGWINIKDVVDEEIVQRTDAETGNSFYIDHGLNGNKSTSGAIFADYRNTLNGRKTSDNIILYGHNQKDNTRFGNLDKYKWNLTNNDCNYFKKHNLINFSTNYQSRQYKIFAIFVTNVEPKHDNGNVFDYQNYLDLSDEARYNQFMDQVMQRTLILSGIDVKYGDKFLTLSTCSTEFEPSRLVFVARQLRDGESTEIDETKLQINANAKWPAVCRR